MNRTLDCGCHYGERVVLCPSHQPDATPARAWTPERMERALDVLESALKEMAEILNREEDPMIHVRPEAPPEPGARTFAVAVTCPECGEVAALHVRPEDYAAWAGRHTLIQHAFPYLRPEDRERLKSGICPACWDRLFKPDES